MASEEAEEVPGDDCVDYKSLAVSNDTEEDNEVAEILHSEDNEVSYSGKGFSRGVMHGTGNPCPVTSVSRPSQRRIKHFMRRKRRQMILIR